MMHAAATNTEERHEIFEALMMEDEDYGDRGEEDDVEIGGRCTHTAPTTGATQQNKKSRNKKRKTSDIHNEEEKRTLLKNDDMKKREEQDNVTSTNTNDKVPSSISVPNGHRHNNKQGWSKVTISSSTHQSHSSAGRSSRNDRCGGEHRSRLVQLLLLMFALALMWILLLVVEHYLQDDEHMVASFDGRERHHKDYNHYASAGSDNHDSATSSISGSGLNVNRKPKNKQTPMDTNAVENLLQQHHRHHDEIFHQDDQEEGEHEGGMFGGHHHGKDKGSMTWQIIEEHIANNELDEEEADLFLHDRTDGRYRDKIDSVLGGHHQPHHEYYDGEDEHNIIGKKHRRPFHRHPAGRENHYDNALQSKTTMKDTVKDASTTAENAIHKVKGSMHPEPEQEHEEGHDTNDAKAEAFGVGASIQSESVAAPTPEYDHDFSPIQQEQIDNFVTGEALMINIQPEHHGGNRFCNVIGHAESLKAPRNNCQLSRTTQHGRDRRPMSTISTYPWNSTQQTEQQITKWHEMYDMMAWQFRVTPDPPLQATEWENPDLVSVAIVRHPIDRLLIAHHYVGTQFYTDPEKDEVEPRNQTEWWHYANESQLRILMYHCRCYCMFDCLKVLQSSQTLSCLYVLIANATPTTVAIQITLPCGYSPVIYHAAMDPTLKQNTWRQRSSSCNDLRLFWTLIASTMV